MINYKKLLGLLALVCAGANTAFAAEFRETLKDAGAFIEPAITYETSDSNVKYPVVGNSSGEVQGYGVSLKAGGHISEALFLGVDGRYSFPNITDNGTNLDADGKAYNWGPVIGAQMPIVGLRLWAGYIVDGQIDPDGNNVDVKFTDGTGYRVGAGFKVYNVSLNLEYTDINYDNTVLQRVGSSFAPSTSFRSVDYENESYTASVSFPMAL